MKIVIIENCTGTDHNTDYIRYEKVMCVEYSSPTDLIKDMEEDEEKFRAEHGPYTNRLNIWQQAKDKKDNNLRKQHALLKKIRENLGNLNLISVEKRKSNWESLVEDLKNKAENVKEEIARLNKIEIPPKPTMNYHKKFNFYIPYGARIISLDDFFSEKQIKI